MKGQKIYVGITDTNWLEFIKGHKSSIKKYINFWKPSAKVFKAIEPGDLFLFKLHENKAYGENGEIVGGAYFVSFEQMSVLDAWDRFGFGNGAKAPLELQLALDKYRVRNSIDSDIIGCIVLRDPFFFKKDRWIESPADWKKEIVSGKKYDISEGVGYELYQLTLKAIKANSDDSVMVEIDNKAEQLSLFGKERETYIKTRVNQSVFRERLLEKYDSCCLCKVSDPRFLIASHIKPWAASQADEKLDDDNGLLLCPNHDALFDAGFISFEDDGSILISKHLSQIDALFMNVDKKLKIKPTEGNKKYLKYHRENIFKR